MRIILESIRRWVIDRFEIVEQVAPAAEWEERIVDQKGETGGHTGERGKNSRHDSLIYLEA
jgi:hypothetical protein